MAGRRWDEKNHGVTWEDIEPWLQSLHEDHGIVVAVQVHLEGISGGLKPAVRVTGKRYQRGDVFTTAFEDYHVFELRAVGECEKWVLHMLSRAQMTLDNEKWLAERGQTSLFAQ